MTLLKNHNLFFTVTIIALALFAGCKNDPYSYKIKGSKIVYNTPARPSNQQSMLGFACDPIENVRVGFVGLGMRGPDALRRFAHIDGATIAALCDLIPERVEKAQGILERRNIPRAAEYSGEDGWMELCRREDIDLVYLSVPWQYHTKMAVYAMEHGKHVAIEVPAATSIAECWELVNTSERTRKHCMMLENCCYDYYELTCLNMAQQGLFGEIVHAEGGYCHNLEPYWDRYQGDWRMDYNKEHRGDVTSTLIRTRKGKTILIEHSTMTPRPYSRMYQLVGTKGIADKYPHKGIAVGLKLDTNIGIEELDAEKFCTEEEYLLLMEQYQHPITSTGGLAEKAKQVGGHGGMDFIMDYRLIYCLNNGLPLDQDVYDAAEWSSLVELTEVSIKHGSMPVVMPDFTRGEWDKIQGLQFAE
ncbi:MAG: Gfo/Idh/MocA family oxidoreductase [Treponema sp.]|jgi:hypothetical protein|nr:Gfo/Idh/MocA family oxidoreductase [Treponema sp.]